MGSFAKRCMALLCAVVMLTSAGGVYATWRYANDPTDPEKIDVSLNINGFHYVTEMPEGEVTLLERITDVLNNDYSNDTIPEGDSISYLLSTLDKDWTGHNPAIGSFVGSMDPSPESRARIEALFGDVINLDEVSFILKAEDLVGSVEDEIALYSTSDPLNWNQWYWTPMVVGVYLTVFVPVLDESGEIVGYDLLCDSIHGYCMEVAYMEGSDIPSFSTDHWRDELYYWHESYAVPQLIEGDDRYKYECYHPSDGNYPYPGRTMSWYGWINVQSDQWATGDYMGKKAWQRLAEILESQ